MDARWTDPALAALRANRGAVLVCPSHTRPCRTIIDDATGLPVTAIDPVDLAGDEHVLLVPGETDPILHLLVEASELDAGKGVIVDRWCAYHGSPDGSRWVAWHVACARFGSDVIEADRIIVPNPLGDRVPTLCRGLNADGRRLSRLCEATERGQESEPVAVGVDPLGLDLRGRFDVIRVRFDPPAFTDGDVLDRVAAIIGDTP